MKEKVFLAAGVLCLAYYGVCGIYGNFKISVLWIWLLTGLGFVAAGLGLYHGVWRRRGPLSVCLPSCFSAFFSWWRRR